MKKLYVFFNILFILSFTKLTAQKYSAYKIIYKIKQDTGFVIQYKDTLQKKILENQYNRIYEIVKDFNYILIFNKAVSYYHLEEPLISDDDNIMYFTLAKSLGGSSKFFQFAKKRYRLESYIEKGKQLLEKDTIIGNRHWKITNETGKLGNYTVIKAIAGQNITAWFTPDIPVPFGPYGEGGLPGLILKIQLGKRIIYAHKIIPLKEPIKIPEPKGKMVSAQEMREKRMKEFAKFMMQQRHN